MGTKPDENGYYDCLKSGRLYQDFVMQMLRRKKGWAISVFSSLFFQKNIGESAQGIEIKLDNPSESSGRLLIETARRFNEDGKWVPSGICRKDNTIHYAVGNFEFFYVFDVKVLRRIYKEFQTAKERDEMPHYFKPMYSEEQLKNETGNGFLWDIANIEERDLFLFRVDCKEEGKFLLREIGFQGKKNA